MVVGAVDDAADAVVGDYIALRRPDRLGMPASRARGAWVALVAARLGSTRLIDNVEFNLD